MWVSLLVKFWREIAIIALSLSLTIVYLWKDSQLPRALIETEQYKSGLEYQNATILKDAEEYERKLKELPKEITKIKTKYKVIYENIDDWEGDKNASDCENAGTYLHSFNY